MPSAAETALTGGARGGSSDGEMIQCNGAVNATKRLEPLVDARLRLTAARTAGLIQSEKQGRVRTCSIRADAFDQMYSWFHDRRRLWSTRLDRLEAQLRKKDKTDASSS
jgi:hypothetical protein